jgi:hypothetical protein
VAGCLIAMRVTATLTTICLMVSLSASAWGQRLMANGQAQGSAVPLLPDCSVHAACLCPWRGILKVDDLSPLPDDKVPKSVARCPGQSQCEWHLFEDRRGLAVYHSRPDYRRDVVPVERRSGLDEPPWESRGSRCAVKVEDGWIVALDAGEFGAGLWWVALDGATFRKLGEPHVAELIKTKIGILAPTGLDHLANGKGEVLLIRRGRGGVWQSGRFASVGDSAYAATAAADGSLLVVTRTSLIGVSAKGKVTVLHRGQWSEFFEAGEKTVSAFYPGSVVRRETGEIFIGMRAAVVRLTPMARGFREDWLAPNCSGNK